MYLKKVKYLGQLYIVRQNSFDSSLIFCLIYIFGGLIGVYKGNLIFEIWPNIMITLTICMFLLQFYLFVYWQKNSNLINENNNGDDLYRGKNIKNVINYYPLKMEKFSYF